MFNKQKKTFLENYIYNHNVKQIDEPPGQKWEHNIYRVSENSRRSVLVQVERIKLKERYVPFCKFRSSYYKELVKLHCANEHRKR